MDAANKFLDQDGLQYIWLVLNAHLIRQDSEITDLESLANEYNVIITWGGTDDAATGTSKIKCVAPQNIDMTTKYLDLVGNLPMPVLMDATDISGNSTTQTISFGSGKTFIRNIDSTTGQWPSTFDRYNGNYLWNENRMRTNTMDAWVQANGAEYWLNIDDVYDAGGSLSPASIYAADVYPQYAYFDN